MAKLPTITTITAANNNITVLNANFSALRSAFTNFLSRDGETPNTMTADLDLNSNDILNGSTINAQQLYLAGVLVANLAAFPTYEGVWTTATAYTAYDLVFVAPNLLYRATAAHTSGTFSTDLSNGLWELFGEQAIDQGAVVVTGGTINGTAIGGSTAAAGAFTTLANSGTLTASGDIDANGDLLFDGVTNKSTVLSDLGAQPANANLTDIAAITQNAGDVIYSDGTDLVDLAIGTAGQVLTVNSGATAPEWATPSPNTQSFVIAVSDETTALTTGAAKVTFRMPYAFTLTAVRASVTTAPTDAALTVDINEGGVSILSTKLTIDSTEKTSTTAATAAVISDSALADDAEITIDIDQVGSTVAGAGLKVTLIGIKT